MLISWVTDTDLEYSYIGTSLPKSLSFGGNYSEPLEPPQPPDIKYAHILNYAYVCMHAYMYASPAIALYFLYIIHNIQCHYYIYRISSSLGIAIILYNIIAKGLGGHACTRIQNN